TNGGKHTPRTGLWFSVLRERLSESTHEPFYRDRRIAPTHYATRHAHCRPRFLRQSRAGPSRYPWRDRYHIDRAVSGAKTLQAKIASCKMPDMERDIRSTLTASTSKGRFRMRMVILTS